MNVMTRPLGIALLILPFLSGCGWITGERVLQAEKACAANDGIAVMTAYLLSPPEALCKNGATFDGKALGKFK
jgi:hypothetical protein